MDRKIPKLSEVHINSLLEDHFVSNWDLKCGQYSTLTIYWKTNSNNEDPSIANSNFGSHLIYRKKPPSQVRRDQKRSRNWKVHNNTPDSGYERSPNNVQIENSCDTDKMADKECVIESPEICSVQPDITKTRPTIMHEQSPEYSGF